MGREEAQRAQEGGGESTLKAPGWVQLPGQWRLATAPALLPAQNAHLARSFVDASMPPPNSVHKRNVETRRGLRKESRRAGEYRLRDRGRERQRNISVAGHFDGGQLQRQPGNRF